MADIAYVKNYKEKELRQYVISYLLVTIASIGFQTASDLQISENTVNVIASIIQMIMTDIFIGALCILVIIFNEIWPDNMKTKLVYGQLPSDSVFSTLLTDKIDSTGIDLENAKVIYNHLSSAPAFKQTAEWNKLLRKCRDSGHSNVVEAERMQLMTRDLCLSTIFLLIMNCFAFGVFAIMNKDIIMSMKMFWLPIAYLTSMLIITKIAAWNRANRFVLLVIKNDVQDSN